MFLAATEPFMGESDSHLAGFFLYYSGKRNTYIICENFNCLAITVHEIQSGDKRTEEQSAVLPMGMEAL